MEDEERKSTEEGLKILRSAFLNKHPEVTEELGEVSEEEEALDESAEQVKEENEPIEDNEASQLSLNDLLSKTLDLPMAIEEPSFALVKNVDEIPKMRPIISTPPSLGVLVNDMVDKWEEVSLPFIPSSVSIYKDILVGTEKGKKPRWLPLSLLSHSKSIWSAGKWKADKVVTNDALLVRCDNLSTHLLTSDISPSNSQWLEMSTKKVRGVALNSRDAWMIVDGGVDLIMGLPHDFIHHHLECEWKLVNIAVKEDSAWAISDEGSLIVRVGYTKNRRFGEDWVEMRPEGPSSLRSVSLVNDSAFVLDDMNVLWRADSVNEHTPFGNFFYRIGTPLDELSLGSISSPPLLSASKRGIFLFTGKRLIFSSSPLCGHRFLSQIPSSLSSLDNFSLLSAGFHSIDQKSVGIFLLLRSTYEMFSFRPHISSSLHPFPFINDLHSIGEISLISSCSSGCMLVDSSGKFVCILNGVASSSSLQYEIQSVAVSEVSTWIITRDGKILVSQEFPPNTWKGVHFDGHAENIFVSSNGRYVWIVSDGKAWAREGIRVTNSAGGRWINSDGCPPLNSLAVGNSIIFALSQDGNLMRLRDLSAVNIKGSGWSLISTPYLLSSISLDAHSTLWMLTREGKLLKHEISIYHPL